MNLNAKKDVIRIDVLFDRLITEFQGIYKETESKVPKNEFYKFSVHFDIWIRLLKYLRPFFVNDKFNSLLLLRFLELQKQLSLLHFSVLSGGYRQSIHELRYILESAIQAYYIDKNHPKATFECKLEVLKEMNMMVGGRLIDQTDLKHKEELKKLYSDLSKHVHSSYDKLRPVIEMGEFHHNLTFAFNKRMFDECINFTDRTMDAYLFLIFYFKQEIIPEIKDDHKLLGSLRDNNYKISLKFIKNKKMN